MATAQQRKQIPLPVLYSKTAINGLPDFNWLYNIKETEKTKGIRTLQLFQLHCENIPDRTGTCTVYIRMEWSYISCEMASSSSRDSKMLSKNMFLLQNFFDQLKNWG